MVVRNHVETSVRHTFESYGFQPIQTPVFEQYDLLAARSGEEIKESMFTFASDAGRYALRPELTSPVCRLIASNALSALHLPYKLYYFGPCFRYCRPQEGRYREFYQAGIELMGSAEPLADAEAIAIAVKTLTRLGIRAFHLRVGDVGVFRQLLEKELPRDGRFQERQSRIISDLDKLIHLREKCATLAKQPELSPLDQAYLVGVSNVLHKLQEEISYAGEFEVLPDQPPSADRLPAVAEATYQASWVARRILPEARARFLLQVSRLRGAPVEALRAAEGLLAGTAALKPLEDLAQVCAWLPGLGVSRFEVVLGMARNLDFYTGIVFEIASSLLGAQRQVCGGGRYDKLVEEFGGPAMPATGFAFGFDRLVTAFEETIKQSGRRIDWSAVDVMVLSPPTGRQQAVEVAERLREGKHRLRVGVDLLGLDLQGQLQYAAALKPAFTVVVGLDELDRHQCKLRGEAGDPETIVALASLEDEIHLRRRKDNLA
jgi:histidyl-tRNA synthetase